MALETTFTDIGLSDILNVAARKKDEGERAVQIFCTNTEEGIDITYTYEKGNVVSNYRVRGITEEDSVPSVQRLFLGMFPFENEAADLFGVHIEGMVLDFAGNFYQLAQKAPMTIISPAQKAAREKAKKQAAAKAAKAKAAAASSPEVKAASDTTAPASSGEQAPSAAQPSSSALGWRGKTPEGVDALIAEKGLSSDAAQRVREGAAKYRARFQEEAGPDAKAQSEPQAASNVQTASQHEAEGGEAQATYMSPILPAAMAEPTTDMVLDEFIGRMPEDARERVRRAIREKEERDGHPLGSQFDTVAPDATLQPKPVTVKIEPEAQGAPRVPSAMPVASTRSVVEEFAGRMAPEDAAAVERAIKAKEERDRHPYGNDGFPPTSAGADSENGKDGE